MSVPSIVLCGIGGYGEYYIEPLIAAETRGEGKVVAVVDPHPEKCSLANFWKNRHTPIFPSLKAFYEQGRCDLVILVLPIHLHCDSTCMALEHGSHVLCEKPLCATLEEMERMRSAEKKSGKTVTLGYQWSFSTAIRKLKTDCLAGKFGAPLRMRTLVCWPRSDTYYKRNRWAGAQMTKLGRPIWDSPVNNGTAHFLHNMLYLLGPSVSESARPKSVKAELWRARAIENYDTAALRVLLEGGAELLFYTSHSTEHEKGPLFAYEFEKASIHYNHDHGTILADFRDGPSLDYGSPEAAPFQKISEALISAKTGRPPLCGIEAASAHTRCMLLAQASADGIQDFPRSWIRSSVRNGETWHFVPDLDRVMAEAYAEGKTLQEMDPSWIHQSVA